MTVIVSADCGTSDSTAVAGSAVPSYAGAGSGSTEASGRGGSGVGLGLAARESDPRRHEGEEQDTHADDYPRRLTRSCCRAPSAGMTMKQRGQLSTGRAASVALRTRERLADSFGVSTATPPSAGRFGRLEVGVAGQPLDRGVAVRVARRRVGHGGGVPVAHAALGVDAQRAQVGLAAAAHSAATSASTSPIQ